jgi:NAD(P)-dependent dehydrogenase (short-subunit alcohol dehydrogenase family)
VEIGAGSRVLVTGASRGLGRSLAEAFAWRGATLGLVARTETELRSLVDELPEADHKILIADVSDRRQMTAAIEAFGDIDVVVANAGVARYLKFAELPLDEAERMTNVNWLGTLYTVQPALARMIERGSGNVVIVSSGAGLRAFPQASVYGATKAAQLTFGRAAWTSRSCCPASSRHTCTTTSATSSPSGARTSTRCPHARWRSASSRRSRRAGPRCITQARSRRSASSRAYRRRWPTGSCA